MCGKCIEGCYLAGWRNGVYSFEHMQEVHVPAHSDHPFRFNPITDFGLIRSPISELSDQK